MDIVALQDRAGKVGCVSRTFGSAQALNCRFLVSEGFKELKWKFRRIKRAFRQCGYSFFNFNGVHYFTMILFALQGCAAHGGCLPRRSEEHTSELQSLMRLSYAVFCLKKKIQNII